VRACNLNSIIDALRKKFAEHGSSFRDDELKRPGKVRKVVTEGVMGHLKASQVNAVKNLDSRIASVLNEFLTLLQRGYSLRYLDDLNPDFNLVIASREFLAELDFTAGTFQESFTLRKDGAEIVHEHKRQQDPRLLDNNFLFMDVEKTVGFTKEMFISSEPRLVYEVRNWRQRG
jgi:hypothetical protein